MSWGDPPPQHPQPAPHWQAPGAAFPPGPATPPAWSPSGPPGAGAPLPGPPVVSPAGGSRRSARILGVALALVTVLFLVATYLAADARSRVSELEAQVTALGGDVDAAPAGGSGGSGGGVEGVDPSQEVACDVERRELQTAVEAYKGVSGTGDYPPSIDDMVGGGPAAFLVEEPRYHQYQQLGGGTAYEITGTGPCEGDDASG